jgi:hypothetical protein
MAALTALRSLAGSCSHTCRLVTIGMLGPPCYASSLEDRNQLFNSSCSQDRGLRTRLGRKIRARNRDVGNSAGVNFNLAMTDMTGQAGESKKLQDLAKKGMTRIGDRDLAFAQFSDQRCITLAGVCPFRSDQSQRRSHAAG